MKIFYLFLGLFLLSHHSTTPQQPKFRLILSQPYRTITVSSAAPILLLKQRHKLELPDVNENRGEALLHSLKRQHRLQRDNTEVVPAFILTELKSTERAEGFREWLTNKLKWFLLRSYSSKTIQGLQSYEFKRAAQQAVWMNEITHGIMQTLLVELAQHQHSGNISSREADIVTDMFEKIDQCSKEIGAKFAYAAKKIRYYGHVRADKEISQSIEVEGSCIAAALSQLKKISGEKGLPRTFAVELRNYIKLMDDIISPKIQTKTYKEIEKGIRELSTCTSEEELERLYQKTTFGKRSRVTMLKETIAYLNVKKIYDEELKHKLEFQCKDNSMLKRSMNTMVRDMDAKIDDSLLRIQASQLEIDFIKQEMDLYRQTYSLSKEIFYRTKDVKDILPIQSGKGFLIRR